MTEYGPQPDGSYLAGPKVAFSGSRTFTDRALVEKVLRRVVRQLPHVEVHVGDADGLDFLVATEGLRWGKFPIVHVCHWPPNPSTKQERWQAAHERNQRVVAGAVKLYAFFSPGPRSPGTSDAIKIATEAGIPVHIYHEGVWS